MGGRQQTVAMLRHKRCLPVAALLAVLMLMGCERSAEPVASEAAIADATANKVTGWPARTLPELAAALQAGEVTAETLTRAYLARIEAIDRAGPTLQSVLALNPGALDDARAADAHRAAGLPLGPLHGVPLLIKDNIETADPVATTAGALALRDNVTGRDAPAVAGLRAAGAIILGKTNLSQWANFRSEDSMSGWSALGGQVRNPHMLDRNPCGSSSGSGAAAAASLAAGAVGTETNGSIICPSNVSGIVGFKPSIGLVSQRYIVPISPSQDTAGPMTKTVRGAAMLLTAMATGAARSDYVAALDANALDGARIGVMRFTQNDNADINAAFDAALAVMARNGATLVDIGANARGIDDYGRKAYLVLTYEFKAAINAYLANTAPAVTTRDLDALIEFNERHAAVELALFDQSIFEASAALGDLTSEEYLTARADVQRSTRELGIDLMLAEHDIDVLVSPSGVVAPRIDPINGDVWPRWSGGGSLAARAGYPHATVPMGHVHGLPIGISFIGAMNADATVLSFAYAYEQATGHRVDPAFLPSADARPEIGKALTRASQ